MSYYEWCALIVERLVGQWQISGSGDSGELMDVLHLSIDEFDQFGRTAFDVAAPFTYREGWQGR